MLQQTDPRTPTWLCWAEVSCSRDHWSCQAFVSFFAKIPLRIEPHWVFLGDGEKIPSWQLWLLIWWVEGKFTKGIGFGTHTDHPSLGTSALSLDGSLSGRTWVSPGTVTGEEIQLQEVQITQAYSRERSYTFWLMHIWCSACSLTVANLAQMKNISPSIFLQIIIALRDLFLA